MFHVQDSMLLLSNDYQGFSFHFLKNDQKQLHHVIYMMWNEVKWGQYLRNARQNVTPLISNRRLEQTSLDAADWLYGNVWHFPLALSEFRSFDAIWGQTRSSRLKKIGTFVVRSHSFGNCDICWNCWKFEKSLTWPAVQSMSASSSVSTIWYPSSSCANSKDSISV